MNNAVSARIGDAGRRSARRSRRVLLLVAVACAVAGIVAVPAPIGHESTAARPASPAQAGSDGYLLIEGVYLPPPYLVVADGPRVTVNGFVLEDFTPTLTPLELADIDDSDLGLSALQLLELGRRYYVAFVPGDDDLDPLSAMIAYLQGLPAAPQVDEDGNIVTVTDAQGGTASDIFDGQILQAPPPDGGTGVAAAAAASLQQDLQANVVIFGGDGSLVTLPPTEGTTLLQTAADLLNQGLDADTRAQQLLALLPYPALAAELAQNFDPDPGLLARLGAHVTANALPGSAPMVTDLPPSDGTFIGARRGAAYLGLSGDQHPDSETPGDRRAVIYSAVADLSGGAPYRIKAALVAQNYTVTLLTNVPPPGFHWDKEQKTFLNDDPSKPVDASAPKPAALASLISAWSPVGVLYIEAHGAGPQRDEEGRALSSPIPTLLIQVVGGDSTSDCSVTRQMLRDMYQSGRTRDPAGEDRRARDDGLIVVGPNTHGCGIGMKNTYIKNHWVDKDTLVYLMACYGQNMYSGGFEVAEHIPTPAAPLPTTATKGTRPRIGAREFLGYVGITWEFEGPVESAEFFDQMAGVGDSDGTRRPVTRAIKLALDAGHAAAEKAGHLKHFSRTNLDHFRRRSVDRDTVLSPAVRAINPSKDATIPYDPDNPVIYDGWVDFDARLSKTFDPDNPPPAPAPPGGTAAPGGAALVPPEGRANEIDVQKVVGADRCISIIPGSARWKTDSKSDVYGVTFKYQAVSAGDSTFTANHGFILSRNNYNGLDGNTLPVGTDHQGPNLDDYVWPVHCVAGRGGTGRVPVPQGGGAGVQSPTPTATASPASGRPSTGSKFSLQQSSAMPGDRVSFTAQSFTAGQVGVVLFDGMAIASVLIGNDGNAIGSFTVPAGTSPGTHLVSLSTAADGAWNATLLVTAANAGAGGGAPTPTPSPSPTPSPMPSPTPSPMPSPTPSPSPTAVRQPTLRLQQSTAHPGQSIGYVAQAFTPGQQGVVGFDGQPVAQGVVAANGASQGAFVVPPNAQPGSHTVTFTTSADGTASAQLQVTP